MGNFDHKQNVKLRMIVPKTRCIVTANPGNQITVKQDNISSLAVMTRVCYSLCVFSVVLYYQDWVIHITLTFKM